MKALILVALSACTTLGPMPATTGISAVAANRPTIEATAGSVPAFYLSQAAEDEAKGEHTETASIVIEPDRWFGTHGLIAGVRAFGQGTDTVTEPFVGVRRK